MSKIKLVGGAVALLLGIAPMATAQAVPKSRAAALDGLQPRSIQLETAPEPNLRSDGTAPPQAVGSSNSAEQQFVFRQLTDRSQIVVSPVKEDRELGEPPGAGFSGNNNVRLLYQIE